jgi:hypothetical protein
MPLRPKANGRGAALGGGNAAVAVVHLKHLVVCYWPKVFLGLAWLTTALCLNPDQKKQFLVLSNHLCCQ